MTVKKREIEGGTSKKVVVPAILTDQASELRDDLRAVEGVAEWVSVDIMDGKFVANTSVAIAEMVAVIKEVKPKAKLEADLMVMDPESYFRALKTAGFRKVIFRVIAVSNPEETIRSAKAFGFETGIALNPDTGIEEVAYYLGQVDTAMLLAIEPGFQGQEFIPDTIRRIKKLRRMLPDINIQVDGGIKRENIKEVAGAGADFLAVGSGIFGEKDPKTAYQELLDIV